MRIIFIIIFFIIVLGLISSVSYFLFTKETMAPITQTVMERSGVNEMNTSLKLIDFSKINSEFLFSAEIPKEFEAEYVPQLRAINIYNPNLSEKNKIEKSQIYITFFKADGFLTLNTVEITQSNAAPIKGHEAILYEITKKPEVPNFSGQPSWRNFKHKAIDIRFSKNNPGPFYSFAYNTNLGTGSSQASAEKIFNDFINSLVFYN